MYFRGNKYLYLLMVYRDEGTFYTFNFEMRKWIPENGRL